MDASIISAISAGVGVLVTSVGGIIIAKVNGKKDLTISDRQQLSQDQQAFYDLVMKQVKVVSDRADTLEGEMIKWKEEALQLRIEDVELRAEMLRLQGIIAKMKDGGTYE